MRRPPTPPSPHPHPSRPRPSRPLPSLQPSPRASFVRVDVQERLSWIRRFFFFSFPHCFFFSFCFLLPHTSLLERLSQAHRFCFFSPALFFVCFRIYLSPRGYREHIVSVLILARFCIYILRSIYLFIFSKMFIVCFRIYLFLRKIAIERSDRSRTGACVLVLLYGCRSIFRERCCCCCCCSCRRKLWYYFWQTSFFSACAPTRAKCIIKYIE